MSESELNTIYKDNEERDNSQTEPKNLQGPNPDSQVEQAARQVQPHSSRQSPNYSMNSRYSEGTGEASGTWSTTTCRS